MKHNEILYMIEPIGLHVMYLTLPEKYVSTSFQIMLMQKLSLASNFSIEVSFWTEPNSYLIFN